MDNLRTALAARYDAQDALDAATTEVARQSALAYHDASMPVNLDRDAYITLASCGIVGFKITRHYVEAYRTDDASRATMATFDDGGLHFGNGVVVSDLLPSLSGVYLELGDDESTDRSMISDMLVAAMAHTDVAQEVRRG